MASGRSGWPVLTLAVGLAAGGCLPAQNPAASGAADFAALSARAAAQAAGHPRAAAALYRQALALRPGWVQGWWSLGSLAYDGNDYAAAVHDFGRVAALDPQAGTARVMLGLSEFALGRYDAALRHIEAGRRIGTVAEPRFLHVMWYHEGLLRLGRGQFDEAQAPLDRLARAGAADDAALTALGMAALRIRGRDPARLPGASQAMALAVGRAEALAAGRDLPAAQSAYAALLAAAPRFPNLHYAYGRFLLGSGQNQRAIAAFQAEIRNNPGHILARLEIAEIDADLAPARGLPYARQAVRLAPRLALGHYLLGLLLVDLHQPARAIPQLEIARRADPGAARVYYVLGNAYAQTGRRSDAARVRATFVRLSRQSDGHPPRPR